jgi:hypothetical protein
VIPIPTFESKQCRRMRPGRAFGWGRGNVLGQRGSDVLVPKPIQCCLARIEETEAAENTFPRSLRKPRDASSAEISRSDRWPPFRPTPA